MNELLSDRNPFRPPVDLDFISEIIPDKGEQIMDGMLLSQYANSPNMKEYFMAFISELDLLFEQTAEVYYGRFIELAVGTQLDVIGIILQQQRSVILPTVFFGFQGALDVAGMSNETTPAIGGIFKDENIGDGEITALDDITYRRMLLAKAALLNRETCDLTLTYFIIGTLLNRAPSVFELRDSDSGVGGIDNRRVDLLISGGDVSDQEIGLILYMTKYFVPAGVTFTITQV